jgi:hypothetical protein
MVMNRTADQVVPTLLVAWTLTERPGHRFVIAEPPGGLDLSRRHWLALTVCGSSSSCACGCATGWHDLGWIAESDPAMLRRLLRRRTDRP